MDNITLNGLTGALAGAGLGAMMGSYLMGKHGLGGISGGSVSGTAAGALVGGMLGATVEGIVLKESTSDNSTTPTDPQILIGDPPEGCAWIHPEFQEKLKQFIDKHEFNPAGKPDAAFTPPLLLPPVEEKKPAAGISELYRQLAFAKQATEEGIDLSKVGDAEVTKMYEEWCKLHFDPDGVFRPMPPFEGASEDKKSGRKVILD